MELDSVLWVASFAYLACCVLLSYALLKILNVTVNRFKRSLLLALMILGSQILAMVTLFPFQLVGLESNLVRTVLHSGLTILFFYLFARRALVLASWQYVAIPITIPLVSSVAVAILLLVFLDNAGVE